MDMKMPIKSMQQPGQPVRVESRLPGGLAVLAVVLLAATIPGRISLFPAWIPYTLMIIIIIPMIGAMLTPGKGYWEKIERIVTMIFCIIMISGTLANLANLIRIIVLRAAEVKGTQLLASSIGVWIANVLAFSLLYWQLDRGGPGCRENNENIKPDWIFPQTDVPEQAPTDWQLSYIDYLFLAFTTATAFSPTDALPLTARAKILVMIESSISLVTIVVVASRAINILGG